MREKGLIVGVDLKRTTDPWSLEASLDELAALAEAAGVEVVGVATQRLDRPFGATYVGKGKMEEIKLAALELGAEVVLFDHELSPTQQRNLERELDVKVIDRTALILDVFARHARTREGMLQVELAQYEYRLPRLTRMWTHLARQAGGRAGGAGGGVGVRGPGETQIEIDKREIGRRVAFLRDELETLRRQRRLSREGRRESGLATVSLVGYTNAGKSTLLNSLADADVYVADQLFATLDPTTRRITLPSGRTVLLSDTVGFIQKLPTQLVAAFTATLEEITEADLLLHVVDITHPDAVRQAETVEKVLAEMGLAGVPMVVAANKIDMLAPASPPVAGVGGNGTGKWAAESTGAITPVSSGREELAEGDDTVADSRGSLEYLRDLYPELIPISAAKRKGLEPLLAALDAELEGQLIAVEAVIPYTAGNVLSLVHTHGIVDSETFSEAGTALRARVPRYLRGSLAPYMTDEG